VSSKTGITGRDWGNDGSRGRIYERIVNRGWGRFTERSKRVVGSAGSCANNGLKTLLKSTGGACMGNAAGLGESRKSQMGISEGER